MLINTQKGFNNFAELVVLYSGCLFSGKEPENFQKFLLYLEKLGNSFGILLIFSLIILFLYIVDIEYEARVLYYNF